MEFDINSLRFPIGRFKGPESYDLKRCELSIETLRELPAILSQSVSGLTERELQYIYRPDGWSIRQLVHHLADSHMNSLLRIKLALTEETPIVPGYQEQIWATLPDVAHVRIDASLDILNGIHQRMVAIFEHMQPADYERTYFHAESQYHFPLYKVLALYDWHSRHHVAHIELAKSSKSQFQ